MPDTPETPVPAAPVPAPTPVPAGVAQPEATPAPVAPATTAPEQPDSLLGGAKASDSKPGEVPGATKTETAVAPEKYADFKLPEGVQLDKAMVDKALPLFKELNLSQENAQKLVTFQAESVKAEIAARQASSETLIKGWREESMKSLGPNAKQELAFAGKTLDAFGSPELRQELTQSGFGENPRLVSMLVKIGKMMSEARTFEGTRTPPMDPLTETKLAMFPSMKDQILAGNGHK